MTKGGRFRRVAASDGPIIFSLSFFRVRSGSTPEIEAAAGKEVGIA